MAGLPLAIQNGSSDDSDGPSLLKGGDKILLHHEKIRVLLDEGVENVTPVSAHVYLTNSCNHNCTYCSEIQFRNDYPARMKDDRAYALMDQLAEAGVQSVVFIGGGEPTLHKKFASIVCAADATGLQVGLVTNGSQQSMVDVCELYKWVRISMDGGRADLYAKTRRVDESEFHNVLENIMLMRSSAPDLVIGVQLLIADEETWEAIPYFLDTLADAGATYALVKIPVTFDWFDASRFKKDDIQISHPRIKVYVSGENMVKSNAGLPCWAHRLNATIAADGKLYTCCRLVNTGQYEKARMADLADYPDFLSAWQSQPAVEASSRLLKTAETDSCPTCWMTRFNKSIDSIRPEDFASMAFI